MKLTMLGTGNALVTECYNTCFVLSDEYGHFLVDGGGGNTVLSQLKKAGIDLMDVHEIFVTHKHVDHIMGIVWVIRIICQNMKKGTYQVEATFFDIGSTKAKQFGFQMIYDGGKVLTCCGDEPYNECEEKYAKGSDWMFHEAFCLYGQRDIFNPYEKHHSTVKDASELAENLGVKNLVLYHTEDKNIKKRKELYGAEGREYYHGNLFVPDDLDVIEM